MTRKLIEQMLEALKYSTPIPQNVIGHNAAITAAREYLATPQEGPVAYIRKDQLQKAAVMAALCEVTPEPRQDRIGIYTHPAPEAKEQPTPTVERKRPDDTEGGAS